MDLSTIKQLDEWMTANCYNDSYGIGTRIIHEGYGLDAVDRSFVWYYTERGKRQLLNRFQTEQDAVRFAFGEITADTSANRHMVGFIQDDLLEQELVAELANRQIEFWKDVIPYGGLHDKRSRIFVFGCDIHKVLDLQQKYGTPY